MEEQYINQSTLKNSQAFYHIARVTGQRMICDCVGYKPTGVAEITRYCCGEPREIEPDGSRCQVNALLDPRSMGQYWIDCCT
ncbi:predicted protein [Plenodomus lingam JN3]|uniref:Predicted protein n=1 Tax=Leptosphaeria maculans (strain JN3 / isolate v23.1.3 / race Av1-4-5-6-7-8) TaxID=985895 RepID=E5A573_LEPMJ|nr:predicted protein [Plenodomus lingam JN3]CBX98771.1 predicted protein [Plenodomus lingam JN3]